jgi:dihydropteroate synthase
VEQDRGAGEFRRLFQWGRQTYIMGILNLTPDSFSGDGLLADQVQVGDPVEAALAQARRFAAEGAHILDIGGESTRPGSQPVSAEEEAARILPAIEAIVAELDILISVDTYKASVARQALQAGAGMVNDIWGLRADPEMGHVAAEFNVPVVLMHNRSSWAHAEIKEQLGGRYIGMAYTNLMEDVRRELLECVELAHRAGVQEEQIILDPGLGFGKTVEQSLELLDRLDEIRSLGFPVLFGPSRKSFIGYSLDLPPDQRLEGTAAAAAIGIARGGDILRVHDVGSMARVARMSDAITRRSG